MIFMRTRHLKQLAFFGFAECYSDPPRYPVVQIKPTIYTSQLTMDTFDFGEVQIASNGKQSKQITP